MSIRSFMQTFNNRLIGTTWYGKRRAYLLHAHNASLTGKWKYLASLALVIMHTIVMEGFVWHSALSVCPQPQYNIDHANISETPYIPMNPKTPSNC